MSRLAQLLEDVIAGRRVVTHPSTFRLLREFAPGESSRLDELQRQAEARKAAEVSKPPGAANKTGPAILLHRTRGDLDEILQHRRSATIEELEWLLAHAIELEMTTDEDMELRNIIARLLSDCFLYARGVDRTEEFIAKTLGTYRTAYGDLTKAEVELLEDIRARASRAIVNCADHRREHCACWRDARDQLFEIRSRNGEKSAFGTAALAVWNSIESLARNRQHQVLADQSEGPPGFLFNWRFYNNPEYFLNSTHQ